MYSVENLRSISPSDFALMGVHDIAYVKPVVIDGNRAYSVHGADGKSMAVFKDRDVAIAAIIQNDLEPVSVH